jgi:hypothetical protein
VKHPSKTSKGEIKYLDTETKQQQLEWRRSRVLELASQGYSQREIANKGQTLQPLTEISSSMFTIVFKNSSMLGARNR